MHEEIGHPHTTREFHVVLVDRSEQGFSQRWRFNSLDIPRLEIRSRALGIVHDQHFFRGGILVVIGAGGFLVRNDAGVRLFRGDGGKRVARGLCDGGCCSGVGGCSSI